MNITESRDEAFEAIAEMLRSNIKKTKIASKLAADYCVSDKTVYKWITRVEEMYDIEPIESILQQQKSELKSENLSGFKFVIITKLKLIKMMSYVGKSELY